MISQKKGLKLSRHNSQNKQAKVAEKELNDSLDDFASAQPLKAARRVVSNPQNSKSKNNNGPTQSNSIAETLSDDHECEEVSSVLGGKSSGSPNRYRTHSSEGYHGTGSSSKGNDIFSPSVSAAYVAERKSLKTSESPVSVFLCPLCGRNFSDSEKKDKHVGKCAQSKNVNQKTLQRAEELLDRQIAERISLGLDAVPGKKITERRPRTKKADPSDISLALALSESLQTANEVARRNEEELLLQENLSEFVFELRQEEYASGGLAHIHKPEEPTTKIKKKTRTARNVPKEFVLSLRTQAERERLIADRAATILSLPEEESVPAEKPFKSSTPFSDYLNRFYQNNRPLWQLTGLTDEKLSSHHSDDTSDRYYVPALRDILSPPKKKTGYSNILLHVSQLPGRNSSQLATLSNTQDILEELAFKADGGFFDDGVDADDSLLVKNSTTSINGITTLSNDWSQFVNSPMLSDVKILTREKAIRAHRLVLAVRCPDLMKELSGDDQRNFVLDWSDYSEVAVETVVRFIYCGQYQPSPNCDAVEVYRIAKRFQLAEFSALLEVNHGQCRNLTIEEESMEEEVAEEIPLPVELPAPRELPKELSVQDDDKLKDAPVTENPETNQEFDNCSIIDESHYSPKRNEPSEIEVIARPSEYNEFETNVAPPPAKVQINESVPMELVSHLDHMERAATPDLFEESMESASVSMKLCTPEKEGDCDVVDLTQESAGEDKRLLSSSSSSSPLVVASKTLEAFEKSTASDCDLWNHDDPALVYQEQVEPAPGFITTPALRSTQHEFQSPRNVPEVNDSLEWPDLDPLDADYLLGVSPAASLVARRSLPGTAAGTTHSYHTPDPPRLAKKRKIDVTPQPDYENMDSPILQKELDKYGLKPLKRKNAVKLLEHIYEELHPLVTDSESSFQDTPERPSIGASNKAVDASSQSSSDESDLAEESVMIPDDLDDGGSPQWSCSQQQSQSIPLKDRMKEFLKSRPDIHKLVLTYEPIQLEWLMKEMRQKGIRCKTQQLLNWLDEECITFRMNNKRNGGGAAASPSKKNSPSKKSPGKKSPAKGRRTCAKKLVS